MASIKQQIFSGVFYTAIAKYSGIFISLIVTAVLARMLSPDDFGVVAVATVIINFFNIFTCNLKILCYIINIHFINLVVIYGFTISYKTTYI